MSRPLADRHLEMIVLLGLMAAVGPLTIDTYLPSMPAIGAELGASSTAVQQTVSAYFFGLAAGQIFSGPLSDRFGRRPVLLFGFALYLVTTIACALAPGVGILIAARGVQGLGASASSAAGRAVIRDIWSGNRAARAMSFVMMVMAFAPLAAPIIGGQIFTWLGWRAIFWLMLGYAFFVMLVLIFRLPETNGPEKRAGARLAEFFRAYGGVLKNARAWGYLVCGGASYAVMFGYITGVPAVYIEIFGVNPQYFGFLFGINVIGLTLGNFINGRLVTRYGYHRLIGVGVTISILGAVALLACALTSTGGLAAVIVTLFFAVGPVGFVGANTIAGLMNLYPRNAGAASALFGVLQFGLGALAGVIVGFLYAGTPVAMGITMTIMAAASLLAFLCLRLSCRFAPDRAEVE
ncbi:MAG: Bcr/CflA family multidrug efflux MFS transporter [Gammaproteobacteria bacterium]|nr:Bcr/CflA family multidrug efflux MFS transporter [Gammaproteobacteria bacterium]